MLETFVRTLCAVEQELRKGKTSESLLLHGGIPPASKERSAMSTVSIVDDMVNLMKGVKWRARRLYAKRAYYKAKRGKRKP